ncbi:MAG: COR domain-containing protein, partial [Chloroflexota bacterium]
QLKELIYLHLGWSRRGNKISKISPSVKNFTNLEHLHLNHNLFYQLPAEIGLRTNLQTLQLKNLPNLTFPPQEIVAIGTPAVKNYLRAAHDGSQHIWHSKALIIGEGGVGKTCLYNALNGRYATEYEEGTVGIEIGPLNLAHPTEPDVTMHLSCWDFAGQDFNHATHQFFFSDHSLFLLVWNARHGWEQGKLYRWLENIKVRAPQAKVILVATHIDQPYSDYPFAEMQQKYPQIVGRAEVSNTNGTGIAELTEMIRTEAADLRMMGLRWPQTWVNAATAVRALRPTSVGSDNGQLYATRQELLSIIREHGIEEDAEAEILLRWLHELGNVLFFADEPDLCDLIILEPEWLTQHVGIVLRSETVQREQGILTRHHLRNDLWPDLDGFLQEHFLRMMEEFDLAYLIPDDPEDRCLIVERLPQDPPDYQPTWDGYERETATDLRLRYRLSSMQPGIPTWFIARCHRFTMKLHWRNGVLFKDETDKHHALVIADERANTVDFVVRGRFPQRFMSVLRDGFEDTLKRYKGLHPSRRVPCPGGNNELMDGPCTNEFDLDKLENWLEKRPNKFMFECPECGDELSRLTLVEGIGAAHLTQSHMEQRILKALREEHGATRRHIASGLEDVIAHIKRNFLLQWQREQKEQLVRCPNLFTIRPLGQSNLIVEERFQLQLYCQYHRGWHPVGEEHAYEFSQTKEWFAKSLPYIKALRKILQTVLTIAGPVAGMGAVFAGWEDDDKEALGHGFAAMDAWLNQTGLLPEIDLDGERLSHTHHQSAFGTHDGADLVPIRELMDMLAEQDKEAGRPQWGGLTRRTTPEGDIVWLCQTHLEEYMSKAERLRMLGNRVM